MVEIIILTMKFSIFGDKIAITIFTNRKMKEHYMHYFYIDAFHPKCLRFFFLPSSQGTKVFGKHTLSNKRTNRKKKIRNTKVL